MTATKKAILFVHRWLGFISGLVVFIISVTGCIFCFQDEIQDTFYAYRKVEPQVEPFLLPSEFRKIVLQKYPEGKITSISYLGKERSVLIRFSDNKIVKLLYFNPYSGKLLHAEVFKTSFFPMIKNIHLYLFLPKEIGKAFVGICVIIYVVIMVTGLILWWPKRKSDRKRSFRIKWGAKWKRVNYDLHNVLGFYVTAIVIIIAVTGLSFSYKWMNNGLYRMANLGKTFPVEKKKFESDSASAALYPQANLVIDQAYEFARKNSPRSNSLFMSLGVNKGAPLSVTAYAEPLYYEHSDNYIFDKYSGKLLNRMFYEQKSAGLKLNNMNYDIHTGQIAGILGKIINFLSSLISATLPVTGLIIYLGKKKKKPVKHKLKYQAD
jgi:uncharacterized iron-regulated membrane protein